MKILLEITGYFVLLSMMISVTRLRLPNLCLAVINSVHPYRLHYPKKEKIV